LERTSAGSVPRSTTPASARALDSTLTALASWPRGRATRSLRPRGRNGAPSSPRRAWPRRSRPGGPRSTSDNHSRRGGKWRPPPRTRRQILFRRYTAQRMRPTPSPFVVPPFLRPLTTTRRSKALLLPLSRPSALPATVKTCSLCASVGRSWMSFDARLVAPPFVRNLGGCMRALRWPPPLVWSSPQPCGLPALALAGALQARAPRLSATRWAGRPRFWVA
jgi:hypothetical protein